MILFVDLGGEWVVFSIKQSVAPDSPKKFVSIHTLRKNNPQVCDPGMTWKNKASKVPSRISRCYRETIRANSWSYDSVRESTFWRSQTVAFCRSLRTDNSAYSLLEVRSWLRTKVKPDTWCSMESSWQWVYTLQMSSVMRWASDKMHLFTNSRFSDCPEWVGRCAICW